MFVWVDTVYNRVAVEKESHVSYLMIHVADTAERAMHHWRGSIAGTLNKWSLFEIVQCAKEAGAKLALVGDWEFVRSITKRYRDLVAQAIVVGESPLDSAPMTLTTIDELKKRLDD